VVVVHTADGEWFAAGDQCPHRPYLLSGGSLYGCQLECPGHGSRFDTQSGQSLNPPAVGAVPTYPVTVTGEEVYIELPTPDPEPPRKGKKGKAR